MTSTNHSLNDALLTGPVIQDELFDLILRFRKYAVALVADVEKMYRQIRIHPEDTSLQRILWRFNPSEPVKIYELQTVTYGLAPSSFLATRVLKQIAMDFEGIYETGAQAVSEDIYMDDFISGADSIEKAIKLRDEVQSLMSEGGFQLRKWSSNRREALKDLPSEVLDEATMLHFESDQRVKTLGVAWKPVPDEFCIDVQLVDHDGHWTKRKIFSAIAKLYDPLGLVSPVVSWAKIRLQNPWLASIGWDDPVPQEIVSQWSDFYTHICCKNSRCPVSYFYQICQRSSFTFSAMHQKSDTIRIETSMLDPPASQGGVNRVEIPRSTTETTFVTTDGAVCCTVEG
ncbi:uncharacterized protein LOC131687209 [Topomyia yanbarensis]|uniref:uncharacterized protein LOC131687209 n=1 Tax=Topomyia yanbarensis TaxID=2498891 RepID=UPI00273B05B5|nr:uncharacterized protein LOC131687209 [Topomyia yanbarensis]